MLNFKIVLFVVIFPLICLGQVQNEKVINEQTQSLFSLNNTITFNKKWGVLADLHLRRNDFVSSDSFYMVRGALAYFTERKNVLGLGYGHMWSAPSNPDWNTFSNEDFIYQIFDCNSKMGNISILNRFRNEQRWQQVMANDSWTGEKVFSNRIRYLVSFNIPIFKKKTMPSLVISDELFVQFGKNVVNNTFDQNWLFVGIKQSITPKLSFDFGYMNVYQQKKSGYQYDMNHTLRLFFYYKNDAHSLTHFGHHS